MNVDAWKRTVRDVDESMEAMQFWGAEGVDAIEDNGKYEVGLVFDNGGVTYGCGCILSQPTRAQIDKAWDKLFHSAKSTLLHLAWSSSGGE